MERNIVSIDRKREGDWGGGVLDVGDGSAVVLEFVCGGCRGDICNRQLKIMNAREKVKRA